MTKRIYTCYMPFGGAGGGALGVHGAAARLLGGDAEFRVIGGFDNDAYACAVFEYLTGVREEIVDAWALTPERLRDLAGEEAPDMILSSAPCVSSSQLVSPAKAATPYYVRINSLMAHFTRVMVEAWPKRKPKLVLYENVPNVRNRGREVVADVKGVLAGAGYAVQDGTHQCRTTGDLAQNRLRWFLVGRDQSQMPVFLYKAPKKRGKVCGDVLTELPLPGDSAGGGMHIIPDISALNWIRLALIPTRGTIRPDGAPAKGDWRDLRVMLDAHVGALDGIAMQRQKAAQNNVFKITGWNEPAGAVTSAQSPGNGAVSAADPRPFGHVDRVYGMKEAVGTITSSPAPSSGAPSIADPRVDPLEALRMKTGVGFANQYVVMSPDGPARTVTGATRPGNGASSIADRRFNGSLGVLASTEPSDTVTAEAYPSTGRYSLASALLPQAENEKLHFGKYVLLAMDDVAHTVTGATRVGSGAQSIADLRSGDQAFRGGWGVLAQTDVAGTVTGNARPSTGPFSIADIAVNGAYPCCYGVLSPAEPAHAVTGMAAPETGPFSIAADRVPLGCAPHAGAYGVISLREAIGTITASACIDNGAYAVADSRHPEAPPLLWIERLDRAPRRWAGLDTKGQPKRGAKCPLVILADDGTWHRPLTTLELAVLQGLPWRHRGKPLDFGGGSTAQRKAIGNMIPPPVARAMAEQMLLALIAAEAGAFYLDSGGSGVWVERAEYLRRLRKAGVQVVDERRGPWRMGGTVVCDDGAVVPPVKRAKKARRRDDCHEADRDCAGKKSTGFGEVVLHL